MFVLYQSLWDKMKELKLLYIMKDKKMEELLIILTIKPCPFSNAFRRKRSSQFHGSTANSKEYLKKILLGFG